MPPLFAKAIYRKFLSARGESELDKMLRAGLPQRFQLPLRYLLTKSLSEVDRNVVGRIEALRSAMSRQSDVYVECYPSPEPGSAGTVAAPAVKPAPAEAKTVPLSMIANTASVLPYWGTFLYLCANASSAKTILELGSCAGISGCYLASGNDCKRFITVEGSQDLATLAASNIRQVTDNGEVVNAFFDAALDEILPTLENGLDMVHIDGQHEKIATFHYMDRLTPHFNPGCVLVFDDIRWTTDMWETWQSLCRRKGLACTMDVGRYGVGVWDGTTTQTRNYDLSRFTDLWRWGKPAGKDSSGSRKQAGISKISALTD